MQVVHLVVALVQRERGRTVPLVPGVRRLAPHAGGEFPHPADEPPAARREVLVEDVACLPGDLHDEVVGSFEFGHDAQHGEQEAQV